MSFWWCYSDLELYRKLTKVMVVPLLLCGEGCSVSAVGTFVICMLSACCLYFVYQLGCNLEQYQYGHYNTSGSVHIFNIICYTCNTLRNKKADNCAVARNTSKWWGAFTTATGGFDLVLFSSSTTRGRGVAISIRQNLPIQLLKCVKDKYGRSIVITASLNGEEFYVLNV